MENEMKYFARLTKESGEAGYMLMWLLGVPIPILFAIYLLRGCN